MTVRFDNLVLPLAHKATDMRIIDTADRDQGRSSAVPPLIGSSLRSGDVDSKIDRLPGIRVSIMETRTTITRITSCAAALSANYLDEPPPPDFSFTELVQAYFDCRKHKRNKISSLAFEQNLERNLNKLHSELQAGTYQPGKSICFVITKPKPREVWAADFRDRIVHHLFYNKVGARFENAFISDSCACIKGRGTLYAGKRLESKIRSATQNWSKPCFYLKCDFANFFVAIDKQILFAELAKKITEPWWLWLAGLILFHDPRADFTFKGDESSINLVPKHKVVRFNADGSEKLFFKKKKVQEMTPWTPEIDMTGVSVSDADKQNGSPKSGDMIAVNPQNKADRWLVAEKFFQDNYEAA